MDHPVRFGLLCIAGFLLGVVLLPSAPEVGAAVIFLVCGVVLIAWACRS